MTAVALPTSPKWFEARPRLLRNSSEQKPFLGGAVTQIFRLGDRWALDVSLPPIESGATARAWISALIRGQAAGSVTLAWPQLGFNFADSGSPNVSGFVSANTAAGGTTLPLKSVGNNRFLRDGAFISHQKAGGRSYLYMVAGEVQANGSGNVSAVVEPMLRKAAGLDEVVLFQAPIIEGYLVGDAREWTIDAAQHVGLSFTIEEIE